MHSLLLVTLYHLEMENAVTEEESLPRVMIVSVVLGAILGLLTLVVFIVCCTRKKLQQHLRNHRTQQASGNSINHNKPDGNASQSEST